MAKAQHELDRFVTSKNDRGVVDGEYRAVCRCGWRSAAAPDHQVLTRLWEIHRDGSLIAERDDAIARANDLQERFEIAEKERDREEERGDHWEKRALELGDQLEAANERAEEAIAERNECERAMAEQAERIGELEAKLDAVGTTKTMPRGTYHQDGRYIEPGDSE